MEKFDIFLSVTPISTGGSPSVDPLLPAVWTVGISLKIHKDAEAGKRAYNNNNNNNNNNKTQETEM